MHKIIISLLAVNLFTISYAQSEYTDDAQSFPLEEATPGLIYIPYTGDGSEENDIEEGVQTDDNEPRPVKPEPELEKTAKARVVSTRITPTSSLGCKVGHRAENSKRMAVVNIGEDFYIIGGDVATSLSWIPPYPKNPNATIHGVDVDKDCVRDDIEHYILERFGKRININYGENLYRYAIWMNRFLLSGISEHTARTASVNMGIAGQCVEQELGGITSDKVINDLFAQFHNTAPRSRRYISNLSRLAGWIIKDSLTITCN